MMKLVELGQVCDVIADGTHGSPARTETGIPVLSATNVYGGLLSYETDRFTSDEEYAQFKRRLDLRDGDVLLTIVGSIGRVAVVEAVRAAVFQRSVAIIRPSRRLDSRFLFHSLQSPHVQRQLLRSANTSAQSGVYLGKLNKIAIWIPGIEEQKRIAAILDKADVIRRKREQVILLADEFLRSLFLEMFGDPVGNTKGWPKSSFGEQLSLIQYGPRFYNEPYTKTGIRTVRITDLNVAGELSFDKMPRIEASERAVKSFSLTPGDMIFARSGATVGKTALIEEGDPPCLAGAYFLRMRFSEKVLPRYARMVITSKSVQRIISEQSRQSAQQNFSGPAVRRLPMPLPPLERQQQFVQVENRLRAHMKTLSIQMLDAESLTSSLSVRAFRGKL